MGRFIRRWQDENVPNFNGDELYAMAYKKVKRIKGFYSHLKVYFIVNLIIIISNLNRDFIGGGFQDSELFQWHTYSTAFFWGIGLTIHGISVFGRDWFFSKDWEDRKIKEFMEEEARMKK